MNGPSSAYRQAPSEIDRTLQWATGAVNQGRGEDAERLAREVLARIPQHPTALHLLGCALLLRGRPTEAIVPLEKAARARQDPAIETQLAIALRQTGRVDDALARATRAIKRRPAHAEAFHELGFHLFTLQRIDEAIATIEHGLELLPRSAELWVLLGGIHQAQRERAKAKAAFAHALTIVADHGDAHYGLGNVLIDDGEFAPAAQHMQRALAANPTDVQAKLKLAVCLLELGRGDDALGYLRAAVRSDQRFYGSALKLVSSAGHGRFWLRPSIATKALA
jgi:tetratricopeptide (TPR) repeat protein